MYNLDFETIKLVMQEHQKTGFLYADGPSRTANSRASSRIEIKIISGSVISCTIIGSGGQRLSGKRPKGSCLVWDGLAGHLPSAGSMLHNRPLLFSAGKYTCFTKTYHSTGTITDAQLAAYAQGSLCPGRWNKGDAKLQRCSRLPRSGREGFT